MLLLQLVYHWSCSNLCMVVLTCVCLRQLPPTSGCSHLHIVIPHLSLFPAHHCSPLIAPRPLLFPTCCCSLPIVPTPLLLLAFFKVPMAPLLLLLLFAHCYSPLVFPHMVLPPPSLPFASSFWSYKQKPTSNKVSFFLNFTFYLIFFEFFCFSFSFSFFLTIQYNLFLFWFCNKGKENKKLSLKLVSSIYLIFFFINRINPLNYLFFYLISFFLNRLTFIVGRK
jgi:hypothetical protein